MVVGSIPITSDALRGSSRGLEIDISNLPVSRGMCLGLFDEPATVAPPQSTGSWDAGGRCRRGGVRRIGWNPDRPLWPGEV